MPETIDKPVEYAREVVGRDPMATHLGIVVEEAASGYARCSVTVKPQYLNAVDRAHGALVYALADQAFAVACNSLGTMALALTVSINYLSAAMDGERIVSEARPINIARKISVWQLDVKGADGRLIASAQGTAYHK
jgi:acyl-CoA thioesterase